MKKILIAIIASAMILVSANAQELSEEGVQNTLWTGFGLPHGEKGNDNREDFRWAGIIDTLQVRVNVRDFSMDGMLSWGAITNWAGSPYNSLDIVNTGLTQFDFLSENRSRESYYLNFIYSPIDNLETGMGTQLDWSVGPCPYTDGLEWEALSHVDQGDFRSVSGANGRNGVIGYMHYANTYAWKALAARYTYNDLFQVGIAIPDFNDYDGNFTLNIGAEVQPVKFIKIAAAYENLLHSGGNFYTGATLTFTKDFILDAWFGIDGIGYSDGTPEKMWGTGAALYINFAKFNLWIRPEVGFSKYTGSDWTSAFYTGGKVNFDITDNMHLGAFTSFAWGAKDKRWVNIEAKKDYDGGFIFNIRPDFTFDINKENSITGVFEFESITNPNHSKRNKCMAGFFWTYNKQF